MWIETGMRFEGRAKIEHGVTLDTLKGAKDLVPQGGQRSATSGRSRWRQHVFGSKIKYTDRVCPRQTTPRLNERIRS